jgi:hypothetical protein
MTFVRGIITHCSRELRAPLGDATAVAKASVVWTEGGSERETVRIAMDVDALLNGADPAQHRETVWPRESARGGNPAPGGRVDHPHRRARDQEHATGGLDRETRKSVEQLMPQIVPSGERPAPAPKRMTRLFREWQGRVHDVTFAADGFTRGSISSLPEIARQAHGYALERLVFFGLKTTWAHDAPVRARSARSGARPRVSTLRRAPAREPTRRVRCAVYIRNRARKVRAGLQLAPRAARGREAYVASQKHEGWRTISALSLHRRRRRDC